MEKPYGVDEVEGSHLIEQMQSRDLLILINFT